MAPSRIADIFLDIYQPEDPDFPAYYGITSSYDAGAFPSTDDREAGDIHEPYSSLSAYR